MDQGKCATGMKKKELLWRNERIWDAPIIGNTSKGIVPGQEGGEQATVSPHLDEGDLGGTALAVQVAEGEEEEGEVEEEEEQEEGDSGAQGAEDEDGAEGVGEVVDAGGVIGIGGDDIEASGGEDDGEGEPEAAVGSECGSTEGVTDGHFPGDQGSFSDLTSWNLR
ncbi:hypothetical protein BGW36DRAFT_429020 [Talaromyces proteolyticus]|uniref:Uncharacterized protein n=1 Tax=Talaromyces proteolyticus TaxID=1131652 RepID=A0AAD4KKW8_9EURO|nr:uncharacterized protein BGW36DRAFT_429020 [Talaromyces proteolyticus]KAH8695133.1 hypothetical protein BGW36DRAFT_429020 [Talaromyces proteolyticus]